MLNTPSMRVGRILGIPVEVNITWLFVFGLVGYSLAFNYYPAVYGWPMWLNVVVGALTALVFFASIVVHELSHSLVARAGGVRIDRITLFLFGGVAQMEEEPASPGKEFLMAVAGPGASLMLAVGFFGSALALQWLGAPDVLYGPLQYLALINLSVAVFNLLPGFPLDGGRVLRAALWWVTGDIVRATRWAARAGQAVGYLLIAMAVFGVLNGQLTLLWMGLVGWFIVVLADNAYRQLVVRNRLHEMSVEQVMSSHPIMVPGDLSLESLVGDFMLGNRHTRYPVVEEGMVVGLVSLSRVKEVHRSEWTFVSVGEITDRELESMLIPADATLDQAADRLAGPTPGALLALRGGLVVGIITRADIIPHVRAVSA